MVLLLCFAVFLCMVLLQSTYGTDVAPFRNPLITITHRIAAGHCRLETHLRFAVQTRGFGIV